MLEGIENILDHKILGNTVLELILFFGLVVVLGSIVFVARFLLRKRKVYKNGKEQLVLDLILKFIIPLLYLGTFYLALQLITISPKVQKIIDVIGLFILLFFLVRFLSSLVRGLISRIIEKSTNDNSARLQQLRGFIPAINATIWLIAGLFLLDNLGFDLNTIIAGLGIGGIAVALAAQAVLKDLFSYVSILLDRPFEIGDFLMVDEYLGVVEKIGIKTTRIRSLSGEQLIVANSYLTDSRIKNFKRMYERRVVFTIAVTYDTESQLVEIIPETIRQIIQKLDNVRFDRAHFCKFGDSSLDFEVVYYVLDADYNHYMDVQQSINIHLLETFNQMGINFAFPSRTIYQKAI